jgi:membrane-associated phospholipid phosphatase
MNFQQKRRIILVFCICVTAALTFAPLASNAQGTAPGNPTPGAFFRAIQAMNAQQTQAAAPAYVTPAYSPTSGPTSTPAFISASQIRPAGLTRNAVPLPMQPVRGLGPATLPGHAPAAFHQAVRSMDLQQNAPGSTPLGQYREAAAPPPQATSAPDTETTPSNVSILSTDYLLSYPENAWRIISAPYNFDTNDWLVAGGVAATTSLLLLADKEINDTWRDDIRSGTLDDFLDIMEYFGDSKFIVFGSLGGYAVGELIGSDRDQEAALLVAQSFVLSAGLTQGLKFAFRRDRPDDSRDDQYSFFSSDSSKTNSSFPSGHATNAFSMAAVLTNVYDESVPWLGWVLYPIATMTSLARVNNERHWGSDVFLGSALGYFIGRMVVRYSPFRGSQTVSIEPMSGDELNGLRIVHKI